MTVKKRDDIVKVGKYYIPPMSTIVKATSKGQITIPSKWRKAFGTNHFILELKGERIVMTPLDVEKAKKEEWMTVFDALRDNKGRGIAANKMLKVLRELENDE